MRIEDDRTLARYSTEADRTTYASQRNYSKKVESKAQAGVPVSKVSHSTERDEYEENIEKAAYEEELEGGQPAGLSIATLYSLKEAMGESFGFVLRCTVFAY